MSYYDEEYPILCQRCGHIHASWRLCCYTEIANQPEMFFGGTIEIIEQQSDLPARLRVKIAQLEAEPCFPGSHFHGRLEGLKEALEIIEDNS